VTDNPRIEELRRRVQADPTSIAFAALAEEYRRAGQYEHAIDVCRTGLTRHPAYLSARVTLGRALIELNQLDEAKMELEQVLSIAPENLAAIRALDEIQGRRGEVPVTLPTAPAPAPSNATFELDLMPVSPVRPAARGTQIEPVASPALAPLNQLLDAIVELKSHSV
jgi:tetratricopeptide (TPR) repeat protein